jgi:hypothetical protein
VFGVCRAIGNQNPYSDGIKSGFPKKHKGHSVQIVEEISESNQTEAIHVCSPKQDNRQQLRENNNGV